MSYEQKVEACNRLLIAWLKCSELRLGQLLDNSLNFAGRRYPDLFFVEDFDLVKAAEDFSNYASIGPGAPGIGAEPGSPAPIGPGATTGGKPGPPAGA